jgi:hypothetical protein
VFDSNSHLDFNVYNLISSSDSLRNAGGNLTQETVARHSQMVGSFGKTMGKIFLDAVDALYVTRKTTSPEIYTNLLKYCTL